MVVDSLLEFSFSMVVRSSRGGLLGNVVCPHMAASAQRAGGACRRAMLEKAAPRFHEVQGVWLSP
jgi:hypothetical protein